MGRETVPLGTSSPRTSPIRQRERPESLPLPGHNMRADWQREQAFPECDRGGVRRRDGDRRRAERAAPAGDGADSSTRAIYRDVRRSRTRGMGTSSCVAARGDPAAARTHVEQPARLGSPGARLAAVGDDVVGRQGICGVRRGFTRLRRDAARRRRLADAEAIGDRCRQRRQLDCLAACRLAASGAGGLVARRRRRADGGAEHPAAGVGSRRVRIRVRSGSRIRRSRGAREAADAEEHR